MAKKKDKKVLIVAALAILVLGYFAYSNLVDKDFDVSVIFNPMAEEGDGRAIRVTKDGEPAWNFVDQISVSITVDNSQGDSDYTNFKVISAEPQVLEDACKYISAAETPGLNIATLNAGDPPASIECQIDSTDLATIADGTPRQWYVTIQGFNQDLQAAKTADTTALTVTVEQDLTGAYSVSMDISN